MDTVPDTSGDFMPTSSEVLDVIRRLWHQRGAWPSWGAVDDYLYRIMHVAVPWELVRTIDKSLLWGVGDQEPDESAPVGLTVAGLALLPQAAEDVRYFIDTVRATAVEVRERPYEAGDHVLDSQEVPELVSLPAAGRDDLILRQHSIWQTTALWHLLAAPDPETGSWSLTINRKKMRPFTRVRTAEEFDAALVELAGAGRSPADGEATKVGRTERLDTVEGGSFTIFIDHVIAETRDTVVYAGHDAAGQEVAVKRVSLRSFSTSPWYRDARSTEREHRAGALLKQHSAAGVMPMLGHVLDNESFTFVYPLASTTLQHLVELVAVAKQVPEASLTPDPPVNVSPVGHRPAKAARDLHGSAGPDEDTVRLIGSELATNLAELHNLGVIHRDIKPANIMRWEGRWRLGDLGIVKLTSEATTVHTFRGDGTYGFMAPEIHRGEDATGRSDVFSLGCTLFALATGRALPGSYATSPAEALDLTDVQSTQLKAALTAMLHRREGTRPSAEQVVQMLSARPSALLEGLSRVAVSSARHEQARDIARAQRDAHTVAAADALELFGRVWGDIETSTAAMPSISFNSGDGTWLMKNGDYRLVVQIFEPGSSTTPAVQLGLVTVEVLDRPDLKSPIANLVALWSPRDESPEWRIYRMAPNAISLTQVPVSKSHQDGDGALGHQHLEENLREQTGPAAPRPAMVTSDVALSAEALIDLFVNEVAAIEKDRD